MSFSFDREAASRPARSVGSRRKRNRGRKGLKCYDGRRKRGWGGGGKGVAERLVALKGLIPTVAKEEEAVTADELFDETADYILLLRTQVEVLKRLVDIYGAAGEENAATVS